MSRTSRRPSIAIVAALAVAVAGCGDGSLSKSEYVDRNNEIQQRAMESVNGLGSSSNPEQLMKDLDAAQESITDAVTDLKALDPPADWEDEHADLVAALEDMDTIMQDMKAAADEQDVQALTEATTDITDVQERASKAIESMNADR